MINTTKRRAYTLVEVLVSTAVLAVITVVIWKLFIVTSRMSHVSAWQHARMTELRIAMQMLRDDMQKSCYPSRVTRRGAEIFEPRSDYNLTYIDCSSGPVELASHSDTELLKFYICTPWKAVGSATDGNGCLTECVLSSQDGNKLRYTRTHHPLPFSGAPAFEANVPAIDKVIVNDVKSIFITVTSPSGGTQTSALTGDFIGLTSNYATVCVTCRYPNPDDYYDKTTCSQHTGAKIETEFQTF